MSIGSLDPEIFTVKVKKYI